MSNTPSALDEADRAAGEALRLMRIAQGLTLRQLAEKAGTNHAYLSQVERGEKVASARWMRAVMEALTNNLAGVA